LPDWDNSVAESFFATLEKELIYGLGVVGAPTIKQRDQLG